MALVRNWIEDTPYLPYTVKKSSKETGKKVNTSVIQVVVQVTIPSDSQPDEDLKVQAREIGRNSILDHYNKVTAGASAIDFTQFQAVQGPYVELKKYDASLETVSVLYLIEASEGYVNSFPELAPEPIGGMSKSGVEVTVEQVIDFFNKLETVALAMEEYEDPYKAEKFTYNGPNGKGYFEFSFKEEAKRLRDFWETFWRFLELNGVKATDGIQIRWIDDGTKLGEPPTGLAAFTKEPPDILYVAKVNRFPSERTPSGISIYDPDELQLTRLSKGFSVYFKGKDALLNGRTNWLVANLDLLMSEPGIAGAFERCQKAGRPTLEGGVTTPMEIGKTSPNPPDSKLPLMDFVEKYILPRPRKDFFNPNEDPEEKWRKLGTGGKSAKTAAEVEEEDQFISEDTLNKVVMNRRTKANDFVGDQVFANLPDRPSKIRSIHDAYAYVLNRVDLPTLVAEALACIGADISLDDIEEAACDAMLRQIFSDGELETLLNFLEGKDPVYFGPEFLDVDSTLLINEMRGYLAETAKQNQGNMTGSSAIDGMLAQDFMTLSAKKLLCRAIVAGGFALLMAIIELIRRGALPPSLSIDFSFGDDEQPPFKRCDPAIAKLVDNIPGKDYLLKQIQDEIQRQITNLLEELIVTPVRESLQALIDSCYDQGGASIPSVDLGTYVPVPVSPAAQQRLGKLLGALAEDDPEKEPTIDITKFLSDVSDLLTKAQYCALLEGAAPPSVLNAVKKLINMSYPQLSQGLSTGPKISSFFVSIAPALDTSICEQLSIEEPPSLADLCLVKGLDEGPMRRALSDLNISDDLIEAQIAANKTKSKEKMKELFGALLSPKSDLDMTFLIEELKAPAILAIKSTFTAIQKSFEADMKQFLFLMNKMENSDATGGTLFKNAVIDTTITKEGDVVFSFSKKNPVTNKASKAELKIAKLPKTSNSIAYSFNIYEDDNLVYTAAEAQAIPEQFQKLHMYTKRNMGGNRPEIGAIYAGAKRYIDLYYDWTPSSHQVEGLEYAVGENQERSAHNEKAVQEKINNKIKIALRNVIDNGTGMSPGSTLVPNKFYTHILENDLNYFFDVAKEKIDQQLGNLAQKAAEGELNLETLFDIGEAPDARLQTEGRGLLKIAVDQHTEAMNDVNLNEAKSTTPFVQNSLFIAPAAGLPRAFMKFDIIKNLLRMFYASAIFKISDIFKNPLMYNFISKSFKYKNLFKEVNLWPQPTQFREKMFREVTEEISENYQEITGIEQIDLEKLPIYDLPSYWGLSYNSAQQKIKPEVLHPIDEGKDKDGDQMPPYEFDLSVFSALSNLLNVEKIAGVGYAGDDPTPVIVQTDATYDTWKAKAPEKIYRAESSTFSNARFVKFDYDTGKEKDRAPPGFIIERYIRVMFKAPDGANSLIEGVNDYTGGAVFKGFAKRQKYREWSVKMPVEWKGIPGRRSAFISPEDWDHNIFRHAPLEYGGHGSGTQPLLKDWFEQISFGMRLSYLLPKPGEPGYGDTPGSGFGMLFDGTSDIHGDFPPPTHDGRFVMNKMFKSFSLIELPNVYLEDYSPTAYFLPGAGDNDPLYQDLGAEVNLLPVLQIEEPAFFELGGEVRMPWQDVDGAKLGDIKYTDSVQSRLQDQMKNNPEFRLIFDYLIPRHNYTTLFAFFNFIIFDLSVGGGKILTDVDDIDDLFNNTENVFEHTFRTLYEEAGYRIGVTTINGAEEFQPDGSVSINGPHLHQFVIDQNGNGVAINAYSPDDDTIFHYHNILNYNIIEAENSKIGLHTHDIAEEGFYEPGTYQPDPDAGTGTFGSPLWKVITGEGIDIGPIFTGTDTENEEES
jgi:hypothetical protein